MFSLSNSTVYVYDCGSHHSSSEPLIITSEFYSAPFPLTLIIGNYNTNRSAEACFIFQGYIHCYVAIQSHICNIHHCSQQIQQFFSLARSLETLRSLSS